MSKNKIRFAGSFVPILALHITLGSLGSLPIISRPIIDVVTQNQEISATKLEKKHAQVIDSYFESRNMPLAGFGLKMVLEAQNNDIDWRLLPAIAIRESSGGKNICGNNPFGWGSCKIHFDTVDEAIETIAWNLGGNNPNTEKYYNLNDTRHKLHHYNGTVIRRYEDQVLSIMDQINNTD